MLVLLVMYNLEYRSNCTNTGSDYLGSCSYTSIFLDVFFFDGGLPRPIQSIQSIQSILTLFSMFDHLPAVATAIASWGRPTC